MMNKNILLVMALVACTCSMAQTKPGNDASTPLHALPADYATPYGPMKKEDIKKVMDRIFTYLDAVTPAAMINRSTNAVITDVSNADTNMSVQEGDFRITSYEWGVTYSGMLAASEITGDKRYGQYVKDRFSFIAKWVPVITRMVEKGQFDNKRNFPLRQPVAPHALDDGGAMCAAMIKAQRAKVNTDLRPLIDHYIDYISNKEYRLADGTLGRNRPQKNTLWLDDMYMGIPALAQMGALTGDKKYFDDAVKQVLQFSQRMFNKQLGLYMHGWVEEMEVHPEFRWARANGWALMAMTELLDVLPADHPGRAAVLEQFKAQVRGLVQYQSGTGFWHQLLDREDSYLETSATAIYSYCIAHACNNKWIDPLAFAPAAMLAWNAVTTKVNEKGQVEGTCVGTGMAFDPAFYYHRPVNVFAAHGYGPVLLAGAELYKMMLSGGFRMNDSSLQYYKN